MKRLQRKLKNADETTLPGTGNTSGFSKTFTFDRKTFFECSNRMKRLAPTLGRRTLPDGPPVGSLSKVEREDLATGAGCSQSNSVSDENDMDEEQTPVMSVASASPTLDAVEPLPSEDAVDGLLLGLVSHSDSLLLETTVESRKSLDLEENELGFLSSNLTLPRTSTPKRHSPSPGCETKPMMNAATLPASFEPSNPKPKSRRRIWLKPLSSFVSFMSQIGDNVHITSYPQH